MASSTNATKNVRQKRYTKISDGQRNILSQFYDSGMTGVGAKHSDAIEKASIESALSVSKIKKWIGNEKAARKKDVADDESASTSSSLNVKCPSFIRGPTPYNAFCSEFFSSGDCRKLSLQEKNKSAAKRWLEMGDTEKEKYRKIVDEAKSFKSVSDLDEQQRKKLIKRHQKQLIEEIDFLAELGCTSTMILMNPEQEIFYSGSPAGVQFLSVNPDVSLKFRQYFDATNRKFTYKDVQNLFNCKYSEAVGKWCRVPYLKGGFRVENLPGNLDFRPPYKYGSKQINDIMANSDAIKFVLDGKASGPQPNSQQQRSTSGGAARKSPSKMAMPAIEQVMAKVIGEEKFTKGIVVEEEDVEILLQLSQEERLVLLGDGERHCSTDAWVAVRGNLQHERTAVGCVLPAYTDADGVEYWLFYCTEKLGTVLSANEAKKLWGYWLDARGNERTYELLPGEKSFIYRKNVIKSNICPLYYTISLPVREDSVFLVPGVFHHTIMQVLSQNNLLHVN